MKRYAIYYAPEPGAFADAAATWLGWNPVTGLAVPQPAPGLDLASMTADPRKYGFHGTIKAPFRLAAHQTRAGLEDAVAALASRLSVIEMPGLEFLQIGGFLALVPSGDPTALLAMAAEVVENLEPFRAPLTDAEVARRRPERLTPRQRALLDQFGYPYVMEEFRFHLTLSGHLPVPDQRALRPMAEAHFTPHLPRPFRLASLCLFAEDAAGAFHLLRRFPLI